MSCTVGKKKNGTPVTLIKVRLILHFVEFQLLFIPVPLIYRLNITIVCYIFSNDLYNANHDIKSLGPCSENNLGVSKSSDLSSVA